MIEVSWGGPARLSELAKIAKHAKKNHQFNFPKSSCSELSNRILPLAIFASLRE